MKNKSTVVLPLAAALASLGGTADAVTNEPIPDRAQKQGDELASPKIEANAFITGGRDLLGFLVTEAADGTIVAQHVSHGSHGSHGSHSSHTSSRY